MTKKIHIILNVVLTTIALFSIFFIICMIMGERRGSPSNPNHKHFYYQKHVIITGLNNSNTFREDDEGHMRLQFIKVMTIRMIDSPTLHATLNSFTDPRLLTDSMVGNHKPGDTLFFESIKKSKFWHKIR